MDGRGGVCGLRLRRGAGGEDSHQQRHQDKPQSKAGNTTGARGGGEVDIAGHRAVLCLAGTGQEVGTPLPSLKRMFMIYVIIFCDFSVVWGQLTSRSVAGPSSPV